VDRERIVLAEILRPRGNRGEVLAKSQTDVPGRLERLQTAWAALVDGSDIAVEVTSAWPHKGDWVLKFAGVDSIDAAERFRGADLWVPVLERGILPEGELFQSDLVGYAVIDRTNGRPLGMVTGWQQYGGSLLMEVAVNGREVLVPFVRALCDVDPGERRIRVDLPEGLLEL
jgi:16S rRNA processing protein RimM